MPGSQFFMLLIFKGAEVELLGASQESSELRQELAEEGGGEACRRIGGVAGEIGEAGVETGLIEIIETWQLLEFTGVVSVGEEAIEGAEEAGDGLGSSVPVKAILQILSFVLFFFRVDICVEILAGM